MNTEKVTINLDENTGCKTVNGDGLIQQHAFKKLKEQIQVGLGFYEGEFLFKSTNKYSDYIPPVDNGLVFFIDGTRGAGKSTFLISAYKALSESLNLKPLAYIDPSRVETGEHVLLLILKKLQQAVHETRNISVEDERRRDSFRESMRRLADGLSLLRKGHDPLADIDPELFFESGLSRAGHGHSLRDNVCRVIDEACVILKCQALMLAFDDTDTDALKGRDVLECIRRYLDTPRLVILVTGDMELYSQVVRDHFYQSLSPSIHHADKERVAQRTQMVDHLEEQYLLKLFPIHRRVILMPLIALIGETEYLVKVQEWGGKSNLLRDVLDAVIEGGFRVGSNSDKSRFREFILRQPLRTVVQVLSRSCRELNANLQPINSDTHSRVTAEIFRSTLLGSLYKEGLDIDALAGNEFRALIDGFFTVTSKDGESDTCIYLRPQPNEESLRNSFAVLSAEVAKFCHGQPDRALRYLLQGPGSFTTYNAAVSKLTDNYVDEKSFTHRFKQYLSIGRDEDGLNWAHHATHIIATSGTPKSAIIRAGIIGVNRTKPENAAMRPSRNLLRVALRNIENNSGASSLRFSLIDVQGQNTTTYASIYAIIGFVERMLSIKKRLTTGGRIGPNSGRSKSEMETIVYKYVQDELVRAFHTKSVSMPPWAFSSESIEKTEGTPKNSKNKSTNQPPASFDDNEEYFESDVEASENISYKRSTAVLTGHITRWLMSDEIARCIDNFKPSAVLLGKIWIRLHFSLINCAEAWQSKKNPGLATIMELFACCVINSILVEEYAHSVTPKKEGDAWSDKHLPDRLYVNPRTSPSLLYEKLASVWGARSSLPLTVIISSCPLIYGLIRRDGKAQPIMAKIHDLLQLGEPNHPGCKEDIFNLLNDVWIIHQKTVADNPGNN